MKARMIGATALVLAAGAAGAYWAGMLEPGGLERASSDPFGRAEGRSEEALVAAPLAATESVAAAGRVRLEPPETAGAAAPNAQEPAALASRPSDLASAAAAPDRTPPAIPQPESTLIELDTDRPDPSPDLSPPATGLGEPPASSEAALEFNREGPVDAALSNARRAADMELGSLAEPEDSARDQGSEWDIRPEFDVVRVAKDGSAVLAGRAAPGAVVKVLVDGAPSETVRANVDGEFVALIAAPSNPSRPGAGRRIDLSARNPDGTVLDSIAPVIVAAPAAPEAAPVAVRPSEDSVELLQPPGAKADGGRVTIDTVTYGEQGSVMVAGRGKPGDVARLYLDNALEAEARVSPDGDWRARITREIAPAVYDLRVDQTSTKGVVTSRAETPFERARPADIKLEKGSVVVQPGNNLWRIADYLYGQGARYTVIYGANRDQIRDPDLIYPGQILNVPQAAQSEARDG